MRAIQILLVTLFWLIFSPALAEPLEREVLAELIMPPFSLGEPINDKGVYTLLNSGGAEAGFVFETEPLAALPGFSGAPIGGAHRIHGGGKAERVALVKHEKCRVEGAWVRFEDGFFGFH